MTPTGVDFDRDARAEMDDAIAWYFEQSPTTAQRFINELDRAFHAILESPTRWRRIDAEHRGYLVRDFRYRLIYRPTLTGIHIVAVMHTSRRPGYSKRRS